MPNLRKSPLVSTRCHTTALSHGTTLHHVVGDASAGRPDDATLAEMPWNSRTFAAADCTRADELKRLGHQLAEVVRPDGNETMAFVDVWMAQVVPRDMDDHVATARSTSIRYMVRPRCPTAAGGARAARQRVWLGSGTLGRTGDEAATRLQAVHSKTDTDVADARLTRLARRERCQWSQQRPFQARAGDVRLSRLEQDDRRERGEGEGKEHAERDRVREDVC
eukprot:631781-Prymnesium_polylepis.1